MKLLRTIIDKESPKTSTTVAMVNGMIGGTILTLPLYALSAGSGYSVIVLTITGFFSFYSCYLCIIHLGEDKDLDYSVLKHFSGSRAIKIFYDLVVFINLLLILILYFELIVQQWQGLTSSTNIAIPLCNGVGIFIFVLILKYFQMGTKIMAYGIISIVAYVIFLIWLISTAPSGPKVMPSFGRGSVNMAAAMGQAYSIQTFFIPVLKKSNSPGKYVLLTFLAYLIGYGVYMFIAYAGSYGILNRSIPPNVIPQTIQGYFGPNLWQVDVLQTLYLVHLYSASPQFLLVSKKRLFSAFKIPETQKGRIPIPQIIYTLVLLIICVVVDVVNVQIEALIQVNGAVIGFFFIYFIPAALHFKCMYFCEREKEKKEIQSQNVDNDDQKRKKTNIQIAQLNSNRPTIALTVYLKKNQQQSQIEESKRKEISQLEYEKRKEMEQSQIEQEKRKELEQFISQSRAFTCTYKRPSIPLQILQILLVLIMFLMGVFIMVNGIISLVTGSYKTI